MNTKLTLNVDESIVEEAKIYASYNKISLSKLVENYLQSLTREEDKINKVSPLVESLTGVIPDNVDERKAYRDYITKKYS